MEKNEAHTNTIVAANVSKCVVERMQTKTTKNLLGNKKKSKRMNVLLLAFA